GRVAASAVSAAGLRTSRRARERLGSGLSLGFVPAYLSVIVALPIAALVWASTDDGAGSFWDAVSSPEGVAALKLTLAMAGIVAVVNAVFGTLIAWVLVRDDFRGKSVVNSVIDLPFALPTVVAGLVLIALYGPRSPVHWNVYGTRTAIVLAPVAHLADHLELRARAQRAHEAVPEDRVVVGDEDGCARAGHVEQDSTGR